MTATKHMLQRPILILALAGGALFSGCSTAAVEIGLEIFEGLTAGLDTGSLLDVWIQSVVQGG